jgi:hypothetical protein
LARSLFTSDSRFKELPAAKDLLNTFIFSYVVSGYVLALRCIKDGGAMERHPKISVTPCRCTVCGHATYFDGSLSSDKKAQGLYEATSELLKLFHRHFKAPQPEAGATVQ